MSTSFQPEDADDYRSLLVSGLSYLVEVREKVFGTALNLAMKSELKDISEAFDVGDEYTFELHHLEGLSDANIQILVKLILSIQNSVDSMMNINNIEDSELDPPDDE